MLNALRQYGVDRDPAPLLAIAAQTLYPVRRENLLMAFKTCVPKKLWGSFDVQIEKHRSEALGLQKQNKVANNTKGGIASNNKTKSGNTQVNTRVSTSSANGKSLKDPFAKNHSSTGQCVLCTKSPMESPHSARCCGRQACYTCWLKPLALHACPCGKELKKSMLTKLYFK